MINIHPKSSQWLKRCPWVFDSKCFISSMLISFLNKIWDGKWNSGYCNWKKDNNNKLLNRVNDGTYQQFPFGMYSFVLTLSRLIEMEFLKTNKGMLWLDLHWITAYCQADIARWYHIRGDWDDGGGWGRLYLISCVWKDCLFFDLSQCAPDQKHIRANDSSQHDVATNGKSFASSLPSNR